MSEKWTLETAVAFWRQHSTADQAWDWDRFASAEAFILDRRPRSSVEADIVFEVLLEQGPDGRSDGRDQRALQRLRSYVRGLHLSLPAAA